MRTAVGQENKKPRALSLKEWLASDFEAPDYLLGEVISTSTRAEVIAPTGLGKTHFMMALGFAISSGASFLHWRAGEGPRRVLYIDGEMSRRLMRRRIADAVRRQGSPESFFVLSREEFPEMAPLNSEEGQSFIDGIIERIGGVDLVIFDNIQALLVGDMKDEESWQQTLPWVRDLTRRNIGQIWIHHTGHDETKGYGTKTREWQLDTVMLMERVHRPDAEIAFTLKFIKARERAPENRRDFQDAVITLAADIWASECSPEAPRRQNQDDLAFELLLDAVAREGTIPVASEHIPPHTPCIAEATWREYCEKGSISKGTAEATRKAFERAAKKLMKDGRVGKWDCWVWPILK